MLLLKSAYVIVLTSSNQQIKEIGVRTNSSVAGFEGLARDHTWNFIWGDYVSIGYSNIRHVVIMTMIHSLQIWWDACFKDLGIVILFENAPPFELYSILVGYVIGVFYPHLQFLSLFHFISCNKKASNL